MITITGSVKTSIIASEDLSHVYEITKELPNEDGNELVLLTINPTITDVVRSDLSTFHLLNHAGKDELDISVVHFVYLFSKVAEKRLSTKGLEVDEENLAYLRTALQGYTKAKIVIAFGSAMSNHAAVTETKVRIFELLKEIRQELELFQLEVKGLDGGSALHPLFAGIRGGTGLWSLKHYMIPKCYTREGYEENRLSKVGARERFIKNVLQRKEGEDNK